MSWGESLQEKQGRPEELGGGGAYQHSAQKNKMVEEDTCMPARWPTGQRCLSDGEGRKLTSQEDAG